MYQPSDGVESYYLPQFPSFDVIFSEKTFAPSNESPNGSPKSGSCITDDVNDLKLKLMELENKMFGPDPDILGIDDSINSPEMDNWRKMVEIIPTGDLRQILIDCAKAVSDDDILTAEWLRAELSQRVSVHGKPIERLGAYMLEGLVARYTGTTIRHNPARVEFLSHMHTLFEVCPYFKFGCMSANGAIAEAMKDENKVHIIDFQISQVTQWIALIQAFAGRPGGPPNIRITGTYDPTSSNNTPGGRVPGIVSAARKKLLDVAKLVNVPLSFRAVAMSGSDVKPDELGVRLGEEALAVNFAFALHRTSDESVNTQNHRDRILRLIKSLSPKVVTLVEKESNTNTAPFFSRFLETLNYYNAVFESIDVSPIRDDKERIEIEQRCLARDAVNVIACEGDRRVERHELLGKWKVRFKMAGFTSYPLSSYVNDTIKDILIQNYNSNYRVEERDGALFLGWKDRDLVATCAWN